MHKCLIHQGIRQTLGCFSAHVPGKQALLVPATSFQLRTVFFEKIQAALLVLLITA